MIFVRFKTSDGSIIIINPDCVASLAPYGQGDELTALRTCDGKDYTIDDNTENVQAVLQRNSGK